MRMGRSKHRLSESPTQHVSDPKIVALRPRNRRRSPYPGAEAAKKIGFSAVTLFVVVLASGYLLRLW
ncbi:hypothetical protein MKK67_06730 [Methylobacterium sp. J-072]|uniref:hypothetical protein n=1 Tax=Methylobacterium sp. J-072 TaxID=2836651 RepID=UPI001FB9F70B|nr:hypothetical protein [Methylobacterium sp. J-072]MCJ2092191.1 hypothetical protein [Methylobacterium sp. J-072]